MEYLETVKRMKERSDLYHEICKVVDDLQFGQTTTYKGVRIECTPSCYKATFETHSKIAKHPNAIASDVASFLFKTTK